MSWYRNGIPEKFEYTTNGACRSCGDYSFGTCDKTGICFDCWFLIHDGVIAERERIIKLLEDSYLLGEAHPNYLAKLVALIKEEQK